MLDIQFIKENQEAVRAAIAAKHVTLDLDELLRVYEERGTLLQKSEELKSLKNDINEFIARAKSEAERAEIIDKGKKIKAELDAVEPQVRTIEARYRSLMLAVPNIPSVDTPSGVNEQGNIILRTVGGKPDFDFPPKEHYLLGEALGLLDTRRAAEVSGARFAYLFGDLVLMQFGLVQHVFQTLTNPQILERIIIEAGLTVPATPFLPVVPPMFIKPAPFEAMARINPREERYYLPEDDVFLIGSAEHTLGVLHRNETLDERALPLRYIGYSSAFRREAGSYGKDMKGILRLHQFDKLEMESFTTKEAARAEQDFLVAIQEYLVQSLGIAYQVVQICTGDMGIPDARQVDIECWLPGQGCYRETHTADLMTDYQARRLGTRVKRESGGKEFVHMNDATAFAIGRILIAILENYQQADGSVVVPSVLRPYVGKDSLTAKK